MPRDAPTEHSAAFKWALPMQMYPSASFPWAPERLIHHSWPQHTAARFRELLTLTFPVLLVRRPQTEHSSSGELPFLWWVGRHLRSQTVFLMLGFASLKETGCHTGIYITWKLFSPGKRWIKCFNLSKYGSNQVCQTGIWSRKQICAKKFTLTEDHFL